MPENVDELVLEAIKRSTTELNDQSTISDIEEYLSQYDEIQAEGVLNNIKGITHELMYEQQENTDGDDITAEIFADTNHAGSDVILTNHHTGVTEEVQLKATDSIDYIKEHLDKYPDVRVLATDEVANELHIESTGISNDLLTHDVERVLNDLGMEGFDADVLDYTNTFIANEQINQSVDSYSDAVSNSLGDMLPDLSNALATGGFLALLDILKDDREKQQKVIKASIATGLLDGVVDVSSFSLEQSFDFNPLLIASLGTWLVMNITNKSSRLANSFIYTANLAYKTVEYGSYGAIGVELVDLLTGLDLVDSVGDVFESLDFLGVVSDGADFVDGFASLGVGILLSKGVKSAFDKMNSSDRETISNLQNKLVNKNILKEMLKANAPSQFLIGPYNEFKN